MGRYSGEQHVPKGKTITHYTCQFPPETINRRVICGEIGNLEPRERKGCETCGCFYFKKGKPQNRGPYESEHQNETY